jgi:2,3-bisphosphoglycerate-dependent phosphoglycerate mutase
MARQARRYISTLNFFIIILFLMSKIYIIRHGQTIWNLEQKFQGWQNSNLTEKGQNQAKMAGQFLKDKNIEKIFCSPLKRVQDTLSLVKQEYVDLQKLTTILDDNLKECNYGDIEGMDENLIRTSLLLQGIDRKDPEVKFNFKFKNGESYKDQLIRILNFISTNDLQNAGLNTLIVCHMGTMKLLSIALQNKLKQADIYEAVTWRPNNNTVITYDTDDKKIEVFNLI